MPRKERIFGPHAGETYAQHLERLKDADGPEFDPASRAAALMTAVMMKGHGKGREPIPVEEYNRARKKLEKNETLRQMMRSPKMAGLLRTGDTDGMFTLFAETEAKRQQALDEKYKRPAERELVAADAVLLKNAGEGLKKNEGAASAVGSPEAKSRGRKYREMMKRLEHARSLAEKGIQLTGEQTKALITSVKAYNDSEIKAAGGKQHEGFAECMTVLKNYMPAAEFNRYCKRLNTTLEAQAPEDLSYVAPESFEPQRLAGAKTAKQLMLENRERMQDSFTLDTAAEAVAIRQLAENDPNRLIRPEELRAQKAKLKAPGTAFMKVMTDDKARENIRGLAEMGEAEEVVGDLNKAMEEREKELREQARKTVVRTAQGEINRSVMRLTGGGPMNRYFTEQYLADILASEQLAVNARGDEKITVGAFRERAEALQKDPAFRRLADRYINDPYFRENMNRGLERDRSGLSLANAYALEKEPTRARREQAEPEAAPREENREPVREPEEAVPELPPLI